MKSYVKLFTINADAFDYDKMTLDDFIEMKINEYIENCDTPIKISSMCTVYSSDYVLSVLVAFETI